MSVSLAPRICFISNEIPDEVVKQAQVAIVTSSGWHIFGVRRAHCYKAFPLPDVACPVVNVIGVKDEDAMAEIIKRYTYPFGVLDLPSLLAGLVGLGAVVTNRPCPNCQGTTKHCNDCQFLEDGSDTSTRTQLNESGHGDAGPM